MKKHYNIIAGLAMLVGVIAGAYFNNNRYFEDGEEITIDRYERVSGNSDIRVEWNFNFGAALAGGVGAFGLGLLFIGLKSNKQVY